MNKAILMLAAVFALSAGGVYAQAANPKATPTPAGATGTEATPAASPSGKSKTYKHHKTRHHKKSSKAEAQ
jgi:hypothetical protein